MKKIKDIFNEYLIWEEELLTSDTFISDQYPIKECYLKMNDFPDEPMWTLFYKNESADFDDTPKKWVIKYKNEK